MRRRKSRMSKWKRCLAVSVAAITLATGLNYPGLENVFAKETSGYQIDVSYSEESNQVTLTGNMEDVPSDITLLDMTDEDGTEYEPDEFTATVAENGTYTYLLTYSETVPETGKTVEKEETVDVVVDEVEEPAEETDQSEAVTDSTEETDQEEVVTEETEGTDQDTIEAESQETETVVAEEQMKETTETTEEVQVQSPLRNTISTLAANSSAASGISTRAGDFAWADSTKTWTLDDFTKKRFWSGSNWAMNYGTDPGGSTVIYRDSIPGTSYENNGAMFRFGTNDSNGWAKEYWLQQGAVFSDISFDFSKDFALKGSMRVGNEFGGLEPNPGATDNTRIKVDGGATVSFVPEGQITTAVENAKRARGAAYRLGAFGTLPNAVVCEYDLTSDLYYDFGDSDKRNFTIQRSDLEKIGDYTYGGGRWQTEVGGKNIYDEAKDKSYENIAHIGVSTTSSSTSDVATNCIANRYSNRTTIGSKQTGKLDYQIVYRNKILTFTLDGQTTSLDLSDYVSSLNGQTKMKLVFTFGAAYMDKTKFGNGSYLSTDVNNTGSGQIDLWAEELYVNPDLRASETAVRWLDSGTVQAPTDANHNAYFNDVYLDKALWPVEGDRIFTQFNFTPSTDVMPQPTSIRRGTLKLSVGNFSVIAGDGTSLTQSPSNVKLFYRSGSTGDFKEYDDSTGITVTGTEAIHVRVGLTLPRLPDDSTIQQYSVSGTVTANYNVGKSKIKYELPLMSTNGEKITVSRSPILYDFNGTNYYTAARVIKSTDSIANNVLLNTANGGNKDGSGNKNSIHYGFGFLESSQSSYYDVKLENSGNYKGAKFSYKSASIGNLENPFSSSDFNYNNSSAGDIQLAKDTKYVLDYTLVDDEYRKQVERGKPTQNNNRGVGTGKRTIWFSDNVEVRNGYEFYAKQDVTLALKDFEGFDKTEWYNKIAEAAGAKVFKTAEYNFNDKVRGDYTKVTGNDDDTGVNNAIKDPGTPYPVTLRFTDDDGTQVERTISLTIEEGTKPITLEETGDTQTDPANSVNVYQEDDGTYKMTVTFYMEGSVLEDSTAIYAVYGQEPGEDIWGLTERGSVNLSNPTSPNRTNKGSNIFYERLSASSLNVDVSSTTNGNTKIILTFSGITSVGPTGIDYRIYLWNSANGPKKNNTTDIPRQSSDIVTLDSNFTDLYARNWQELHVIPKVTTEYSPNVIIKDTPKSALFYEKTSFTVTATFKLEGDQKESFDYLNKNELINVALYKQNPSGKDPNTNQYIIWANRTEKGKDHGEKVDLPSIDRVGDNEFTVSFQIKNNGTSISEQWDEGANYRIYAWTDSNVSPSSEGMNAIPFGSVNNDGNRFNYNKVIDTIPSTTTTMTCVLGDQVESIIHYPKEVRMLDQVVAGDDNIYSGNEQITIAAPSETAEPNPDVGVDVTILDFVSGNTFNITRGTSSTDAIPITAFKGKIGDTSETRIGVGGRVGTLMFASPNNVLQLYFRSETPPNAADGADYTGQITFRFTQATGTTN